MPDNTVACREWLFDLVEREYLRVCKKESMPDFLDTIHYVLNCNILNENEYRLSQSCPERFREVFRVSRCI